MRLTISSLIAEASNLVQLLMGMVTVILQWLIDRLWYSANEGSQRGVIQHLQISSALCPIKSSHILPEAACTGHNVREDSRGKGSDRVGGGLWCLCGGQLQEPLHPEAANNRQVIK